MKISDILFCLLALVIVANSACKNENTEDQVFEAYEAYKKEFDRGDSEVNRLVNKAIDYAGGWEKYINLRGIEYTKTLNKADSTGAIKDIVVQRHRYNQFPQFSVRMDWEEAGSKYTILNNGQQSWKLKGRKHLKDESNVNSAYNSSYGAQYVLFIPWKIFDPGTKLTYVGMQDLPFGKRAEGVMVNYSEGKSTTTEHTWWYYFAEDGKPVASFLKSKQGYSYTEYIDFERVDGMLFHTKRNSYKSDSTMTELVLRTVYENDNIELVDLFDKKLFDFKG